MDWIKTEDRLPEKPGIETYEQIDCLIFVNGRVKISVWNCEHICWDDAEGDDFAYNPKEPSHWMPFPAPPVAP